MAKSRLLSGIMSQSLEKRRVLTRQAILHHMAREGGKLFGPIPKGVRREFFCLDKHTWVWHEEWTDTDGQRRVTTTRYDVRPRGILKSQGPNSYQRLSLTEERNFRAAADAYYERSYQDLQRVAQGA